MARKLSPQMIRVLEDVRDGLGTHGTAYHRGEHGARNRTVYALRDRGLLNGCELTSAGRSVLDAPTAAQAANKE